MGISANHQSRASFPNMPVFLNILGGRDTRRQSGLRPFIQRLMDALSLSGVTSKIGMMTDRALVEHITGLPHSRANFKQLVRELGFRGERKAELENALGRLAARGDLIQLHNGQYVVATKSREFAVGRLNLHRDGYGFLISDRPIPGVVGDIFIPPDSAQKAMHGDRVIVRVARIEAGGRADGEIVKILKRANATV